MSKYTSEVYEIIKSLAYDTTNINTIYQQIDDALPLIFDFDYPIWSADYKRTLEKKIIMHYFKKEICCETFELWQMFLNERLNLIMPYYNELYLSTIPEYDITKDHNTNSSDIDTNTLTNVLTDTTIGLDTLNGTDKNINAETNDGTMGKIASNKSIISGVDTGFNTGERVEYKVPQAKNGDNTDYASFLETNKGDSTQTKDGTNDIDILDDTTNHTEIGGTNDKTIESTNNSNLKKDATTTTTGTHTITHNASGNNVYVADLIMKHRTSIINIDSMIIEELHDLFMLIY